MSVPGAHEEGYATAIEEETRTNSYVTVLATSDAALLALGAPVRHLVDKTELHATAERAGFKVPPGVVCSSREDLLARARDFGYPVVLKPRVSTVDRKAVRIEGPADLETVAVGDGPVVVQPWLEGALRGLGGVTWRGRLVAAVHQRVLRTWPAVCGGACAATTIESDRELEDKVVALLDGYEGVFQVQFIGPYLIDVNPRPYGSLPLAVAAGANLASIYCELLSGREVPFVRGRPGVFYRWTEGDLRSLAHGLRRGRVRLSDVPRALRPRRASAHSTESLRDPGPMFARLSHAASRLRA